MGDSSAGSLGGSGGSGLGGVGGATLAVKAGLEGQSEPWVTWVNLKMFISIVRAETAARAATV